MRLPRLHLVTDDRVMAMPGFTALAEGLLRQGGSALALHLRTRALRPLYDAAMALAPVAASGGALLVVNDRVDVALATRAGGVQLGRSSMTVGDVRGAVGAGRIIGASVHDAAEVSAADDADFLLAGNVYPTASHPGRPGTGLDWLRGRSGVIAIGGVTLDRIPELRPAVHGVAVLSAIWDADEPYDMLQRFLEALRIP